MSVKQIKKKSNIRDGSISDTKLVTVLSQFSVYDMNRLKKFVDSPYFNRDMRLRIMLFAVDKAIRETKIQSLSKADLWSIAVHDEQFDDLRFRKLCSDLLRLIEMFITQEEFENNQLQQAEYLLRAVHNRSLTSLESTALKSAERLSERYHFRPTSYYYAQYAFQREIFSLNKLDIRRSERANIEEIASNLDKFFIAEKLRYFSDVLSRQNFQAQAYDLTFMNEIIAHLEQQDYSTVVPINLYYQTYLTYTQPEITTHFTELKKLIQNFIQLLPENEAKEIISSALNYCITQVNRGNSDYLREYLDLSELGIEKEVLLVNGVLSPWIFRNIVFAGLRLGDFNWVERFIREYQYHIEERYRTNAVSFNLANLLFYQKNYGEVLKLLQSVDYDDPSYNRNSKTILLATYYELEETESLSSLLSSFELYLRRNKALPENRKTPYLNLIKYLRSLIKFSRTDTKDLQKLRKKVEETESIVNKDWLLEKIDALL